MSSPAQALEHVADARDARCACAKCLAFKRGRQMALRDPVGLLHELRFPTRVLQPCACEYALALFRSTFGFEPEDGDEEPTRPAPNRAKLRQLLDGGLVHYMASLLTSLRDSDGTVHENVLEPTLHSLADLCRIVRDEPGFRAKPVVGQLCDLRDLILEVGRVYLAAEGRGWLHGSTGGDWIAILTMYLTGPSYAKADCAASDDAVRMIVNAALGARDEAGTRLGWVQTWEPGRIWDALSEGEPAFEGDLATRSEALASVLEGVEQAASDAAAGELDRRTVELAVARLVAIVPFGRPDASATMLARELPKTLNELLAACANDHMRAVPDDGDACVALGNVLGVVTLIWAAAGEPDSDGDALERLQRALLPSLELIVAVAQHVCRCDTRKGPCAPCLPPDAAATASAAVACLNALKGPIKHSARLRSIVRDRLDVLLQPLSHAAAVTEAPHCQHHTIVTKILASALGLSVRRRCANVDCEVEAGPDDPAPSLHCCARCEALYVCASAWARRG